MLTKGGWVYIMTNRPGGVLYIGVTAHLVRRVSEHRQAELEGFTQTYSLKRLVYFEHHDEIIDAIAREKAMKTWLRAWKVALIVKEKPDWVDCMRAFCKVFRHSRGSGNLLGPGAFEKEESRFRGNDGVWRDRGNGLGRKDA
jgi:putative endonuclease